MARAEAAVSASGALAAATAGGAPAAHDVKSGASTTMPRVDPADSTKEGDRRAETSADPNTMTQSPRAAKAEERRSVSSAKRPVAAMTAARSAETGIPVKPT